MKASFPQLPSVEPGWVWLVGAGPGEAGLMTLLGWHALSQADIVVHDALIDPEILSFARPGAELVFAGKRGGRPSPKQPDISQRLVREARAGRRVVRLKGGDPLLFGRGGEEALALVDAGIPFRIVPGVSAGVGGLAYAGIPVTHRAVNSAVTFVTGHDSLGDVPHGLDWPAIARGSPVIVLFMALRNLDRIASLLIASGRRPDEPVAIVSQTATDHQAVTETILAAAGTAAKSMQPPAIVVIGEVVRLRAGLDWLGALTGRRLDADPLAVRERRDVG